MIVQSLTTENFGNLIAIAQNSVVDDLNRQATRKKSTTESFGNLKSSIPKLSRDGRSRIRPGKKSLPISRPIPQRVAQAD